MSNHSHTDDDEMEFIGIGILLLVLLEPELELFSLISTYIDTHLTNMLFFVYILPFMLIALITITSFYILLDIDETGDTMVGAVLLSYNLDFYLTGDNVLFSIFAWITNFLF